MVGMFVSLRSWLASLKVVSECCLLAEKLSGVCGGNGVVSMVESQDDCWVRDRGSVLVAGRLGWLYMSGGRTMVATKELKIIWSAWSVLDVGVVAPLYGRVAGSGCC